MPRTIISLSDEDKAWLDRQAKEERVPMTEIVRRAVRDYRSGREGGDRLALEELLERTRDCWTGGDGLGYQKAVRDEWDPDR